MAATVKSPDAPPCRQMPRTVQAKSTAPPPHSRQQGRADAFRERIVELVRDVRREPGFATTFTD
jgi:hypothetical protein